MFVSMYLTINLEKIAHHSKIIGTMHSKCSNFEKIKQFPVQFIKKWSSGGEFNSTFAQSEFQVLLFNTNNSIQHNSFIIIQLLYTKSFKYCYSTLLICLLRVKCLLHILLCNTNTFCLHMVKWSNSFIWPIDITLSSVTTSGVLDLGAITIKVCVIFPTSTGLKPHHQMV